MSWIIFLLFATIGVCNPSKILVSQKIKTNRPIFGIMAQSTVGLTIDRFGKNYIAASYVKFLESSGGRVVPIMANATESELRELFYSINGVLFPGGDVPMAKNSSYHRIAYSLFKLAKKSNDEGDYFPIFAICRGYELLTVVLCADDFSVLTPTNSENYSTPLNLSQDFRDSKMFRDIPEDLASNYEDTLSHFHTLSVLVSEFEKRAALKRFFKVLSTNRDRKGVEFVSTIEAKKYPFYATLWHPEKPPFEWSRTKHVPHSPMSIVVSQYFSNFIVNEARYSEHKFKTTSDEQRALIYRHHPIFTGNVPDAKFEQCYIFD